MTYSVKIFGERVDTGIAWTGSVFRRDDNGQQGGNLASLVRGWCEDHITAGGDDPADYKAEIEAAVDSVEDDREGDDD